MKKKALGMRITSILLGAALVFGAVPSTRLSYADTNVQAGADNSPAGITADNYADSHDTDTEFKSRTATQTELVSGSASGSESYYGSLISENKIRYATETELDYVVATRTELSDDGIMEAAVNDALPITADMVTVSYEYVGTVPSGAKLPDSVQLERGTRYTPVTPEDVDGYFFDGWYIDKACTLKAIDQGRVTIDRTFYAKWLNVYDVRNANELTSAINSINKSGKAGTIRFLADISYNSTGTLNIKTKLTILGNGHRLSSGCTFSVGSGASLTFGKADGSDTFTFDGSDAKKGSLVTVVGGSLTMYDGVTLEGRTYTSGAAAVDVSKAGNFAMMGGTIRKCTGKKGAVAAHNSGSSFTMSGNSLITDCGNDSVNCGALFLETQASAVMYGGAVRNCTGYYGGVTVMDGAETSFTMREGTSISGCGSDKSYVGGIYCHDGIVRIYGGTVSDNTSAYVTTSGTGGICMDNAIFSSYKNKLILDGATISGNTGRGTGGVYAYYGDVKISNTKITGNTGTDNGGVQFLRCDVAISGTEISENTGTGLCIDSCEGTISKDVVITRNKSETTAGGLYINGNKMTVENGAVICNNTSEWYGSDVIYGSKTNIELFKCEAAAMNTTYGDTGVLIDGWYLDENGARYTPSPNGETLTLEDIYKLPLPSGRSIRLIASYKEKQQVTVSYRYTGNVPAAAVLPESKSMDIDTAYTAEMPAEVSGYSFDGWYTTEDLSVRFTDGKKISSNTTLCGQWIKDYTVKYEFNSKTEGTKLPAEVTALIPEDTGSYKKTEDIKLKEPSSTVIAVEDGVWTFDGYSTSTDKDTRVVTFTGDWEYKAYPCYSVSYVFENGSTAGAELPEEVLQYRPADANTYRNGTELEPKQPQDGEGREVTEVTVGEQIWKFRGYDRKSAVIADADVTFTGTWECSYKVKYSFESGTDGKTLPQVIIDELLPEEKTYTVGTKVDPVYPKWIAVIADDETWTFTGYTPESAVIKDANVTFRGIWEYTEAPVYSVNYAFESLTEGMELPDEVMEYLPVDKKTHRRDEYVTPEGLSGITVEKDEGTWEFSHYDSAGTMILDKNVTFTGYWSYTAYPRHKVSYTFVSGTEGKALPELISKELLPEDSQTYVRGNVVTARRPCAAEIRVDDGSWSFNGYKEGSSQTVADEDIVFTGVWEYTADPPKSYKLIYKFQSSTKGKELPEAVMKLLPEDTGSHEEGSLAAPEWPEEIDVPGEGNVGLWEFMDYEPMIAIVKDSDVVFTGYWEYTELKSCRVSYSFESRTAGHTLPEQVKALLPTDSTVYYEGETATARIPQKTRVSEGDGVWRFAGYDKDNAVAADKDIVFTGGWEYSEEPVPVEYIWVSYEFTGDVPRTAARPSAERIEQGSAFTAAEQEGVSGYSFDGWYTDESCKVKFADGSILNADTVLYGRWVRNGFPHENHSVRNRGSEAAGYGLASIGGTRTGWYKDISKGDAKGIWYYYDENGVIVKGWHYDKQDCKWYYLSLADGHMLTGWQLINGSWYYLNPIAPSPTWDYDGTSWVYNGSAQRPYGSMYADEHTPDNYHVKSNGEWTED